VWTHAQVFVIFDDGTYYEFFSFSMISGGFDVSAGGMEKIRRYMSENTVALAYLEEKDQTCIDGSLFRID
jgi:hypothetical protein